MSKISFKSILVKSTPTHFVAVIKLSIYIISTSYIFIKKNHVTKSNHE